MILTLLIFAVLPSLRDRTALRLELTALRHRVAVLERKRATRLRLTRMDRLFSVWLYRVWPDCLNAVVIVKQETVIRWHRRGFRLFRTWKSRPRRRGRPPVPREVRDVRSAPRIHGELLKLGIEIGQATVSKVMVRHPRPPSQKRSSTCLLVSKHSSRRKRITSGTPGSKQLPTLASPDSPGW